MSVTRFKPNTSVACLVHSQDRFLMVEENIEGQLTLNQPAGHLEHGESLMAAAQRELFEETGIQAQPCALTGIYLTPTQAQPLTFLRFSFIFELANPTAPQPCDPVIVAAKWLSAEQIFQASQPLRGPAVKQSLEDYLAGKRLPLHHVQFLPE